MTYQNAWHAGDLSGAVTVAEVKKIQAADALTLASATSTKATACKAPATAATPACSTATKALAQQTTWKTDDAARVVAVEKAVKAAAAKAAAAKTTVKLTSKEKKALAKELVALKLASTNAKALVTADEAAQKKGDCLVKNKATTVCEDLATKLAEDKTAATSAATAVTTFEKDMPKPSSGATVGIVIACVAAVLCIGGGAAWYIKHKKGGEASEAQFGDDLYTAFVDTEEA